MSTLPKPSLKPYQGRSWKRLRRISIVAELEKAFISDQDIANHLGITVGAVQAIKSTPEFLAKRITLQTGVMSTYENAFPTDQEKQDTVKELSALALHQARRILLDPTNSNHAKAVFELLDRDKATSKISRTADAIDRIFDMNKQNQEAQELLKMLGAPPEAPMSVLQPPTVVLKAIEMNMPEESNNGDDLDPNELDETYNEPFKGKVN